MKTTTKLFAAVLFFILVLNLYKCTIITETPGFYSGYSKLSEPNRNLIAITESNAPSERIEFSETKKIVSITGEQLNNYIKKSSNAIVYLWSPNCRSEECVAINVLQESIKAGGYDLFIVAEYLSDDIFSQIQIGDKVFWPNVKYYRTDYCNKYMKLFLSDLTGNGKTPIQNKYLVFHYGVFVDDCSYEVCLSKAAQQNHK